MNLSETKGKNKRICLFLVVDDLGYGGAERQVIELANNLDRDRFNIHVCTFSDNVPLSNTLIDAEHKLHIIKRKSRYDFTVIFRLARLLKTFRADVINGYLFIGDITSRLAGRIANTKLIVGSERNANRKEINRRDNIAYKLTKRFVDVIIANSIAGAESNSKQYKLPLSYYRVVYNGVDIERFKPGDKTEIRRKLGIPSNSCVVGIFAAFRKQKNHSMLFRAFKLVLNTFPDALLLVVGNIPVDSKDKLSDYKEQLNHLVDELDIRGRCMFLGHQEYSEHLYPACDVTVLPSFHEGTPNVLLESMACGIPVVATNVCDNPYIVKEGQTGYLVAVGDEENMAGKIILLLSNSETRNQMGQHSRDWVTKEFSNKQLAEKTASVYIEFLNQKNEN